MSRSNISNALRAITGHDFRKRHQGIVSNLTDIMCRFCGEKEESSAHVIDDCQRLTALRSHYFSKPLGCSILPHWEPEQLAAFLSDPIISGMEAPCREY